MTLEINKDKITPIAFAVPVESNTKSSKEASKQLLALLTALEGSIEAIASETSSEGKQPIINVTSETAAGNSNGYAQSMASMAQMLAELQILIAKSTKDKTDDDSKLSKAQLQTLQTAYSDLEKQLKNSQSDGNKQTTLATVEKVLTIALAIVVSLIAVACGQFLLAGIVMGEMILQETGAFDAASKGLSTVLQDMGMSKEAADIVAKILIVVVVVILTAVVAPQAAAEEVAETTTEIAAEETASTSEEVTTTVSEEVSTQSSEVSSNIASKIAQRLSTRTSLCINVGVQTTLNTGLTQNIADEIVEGVAKLTPMSDKEKKKAEMIVSLILTILLMILQVASATSMPSEVTDETTLLGKMKAFLQNNPALMKGLNYSKVGLNLANFATSGMQGLVSVNQGLTEKDIAKDEYSITIVQNIIDAISKGMSSTQKHESDAQAAFAQEAQSLSQLFASDRAVADLLLQG